MTKRDGRTYCLSVSGVWFIWGAIFLIVAAGNFWYGAVASGAILAFIALAMLATGWKRRRQTQPPLLPPPR